MPNRRSRGRRPAAASACDATSRPDANALRPDANASRPDASASLPDDTTFRSGDNVLRPDPHS